MSIQPRFPRVGRTRIAGQRMAPGGRRWSESPIPDAPPRRRRAPGIGTAPVRIDTVFTLVLGPDAYPYNYGGVKIFSPADGIGDGDEISHELTIPFEERPAVGVPGHWSWAVYGSPNPIPDVEITDPDWHLLTWIYSPYGYEEPPHFVSCSMTVLGVTHVGEYTSITNDYYADKQGWLFPTLSVPFVISNAYP